MFKRLSNIQPQAHHGAEIGGTSFQFARVSRGLARRGRNDTWSDQAALYYFCKIKQEMVLEAYILTFEFGDRAFKYAYKIKPAKPVVKPYWRGGQSVSSCSIVRLVIVPCGSNFKRSRQRVARSLPPAATRPSINLRIFRKWYCGRHHPPSQSKADDSFLYGLVELDGALVQSGWIENWR